MRSRLEKCEAAVVMVEAGVVPVLLRLISLLV